MMLTFNMLIMIIISWYPIVASYLIPAILAIIMYQKHFPPISSLIRWPCSFPLSIVSRHHNFPATTELNLLSPRRWCDSWARVHVSFPQKFVHHRNKICKSWMFGEHFWWFGIFVEVVSEKWSSPDSKIWRKHRTLLCTKKRQASSTSFHLRWNCATHGRRASVSLGTDLFPMGQPVGQGTSRSGRHDDLTRCAFKVAQMPISFENMSRLYDVLKSFYESATLSTPSGHKCSWQSRQSFVHMLIIRWVSLFSCLSARCINLYLEKEIQERLARVSFRVGSILELDFCMSAYFSKVTQLDWNPQKIPMSHPRRAICILHHCREEDVELPDLPQRLRPLQGRDFASETKPPAGDKLSRHWMH